MHYTGYVIDSGVCSHAAKTEYLLKTDQAARSMLALIQMATARASTCSYINSTTSITQSGC